MKTRIINVAILIATSLIFAVSCTEDTEENTNKGVVTNNLKVMKYANYENVNYTNDSILSMMKTFNNAVNTSEIMPDMSISQALFEMETHFNYGIVMKLAWNANARSSDTVYKEFTLPVSNGIINGTELKTLYNSFVREFISEESGENLDLADFYVKAVTSNSVTIGVETRKLPGLIGDDARPACKRFKNVGDAAGVATGTTITLPEQLGTLGNVVHQHSFVNMNQYPEYEYFNIVNDYGGSINIFDTDASTLTINADYLNNTLIPVYITLGHVILNNFWGQYGYVVYNFTTIAKQDLYSNNRARYSIEIKDFHAAWLRRVNLNFMYAVHLTRPYDI